MTLAEVDWGELRRPLVVLVLSLVVSAAMLSAAHYYGSEVDNSYRKESRRLASARGRYLALDDEKRLIEESYPRYQELVRAGRIGEERRLDWIEALRVAAARIGLPSLHYEIGAQQVYEPDFPVETGRFRVHASQMTLKVGLFHEEDLTDLFRELSRRSSGLYSVSDCRMVRLNVEFQEDPTKPNLEAQCRLRWFTVKPGEETPARPRRRGRA